MLFHETRRSAWWIDVLKWPSFFANSIQSFLVGNDSALRFRIYRFIERENLVHRRTLHIAQDTRRENTLRMLSYIMSMIMLLWWRFRCCNREYRQKMFTKFFQLDNFIRTRTANCQLARTWKCQKMHCTFGGVPDWRKIATFSCFLWNTKWANHWRSHRWVSSRLFPSDVVMSVQKRIDRWRPHAGVDWSGMETVGWQFQVSYLLMDFVKVGFNLCHNWNHINHCV